jgi:hypothetical protein
LLMVNNIYVVSIITCALHKYTACAKAHWVFYRDITCQSTKSDCDKQWHEMPETHNPASARILVLCFLSLNFIMQESHICDNYEMGFCTPHQVCLTVTRAGLGSL